MRARRNVHEPRICRPFTTVTWLVTRSNVTSKLFHGDCPLDVQNNKCPGGAGSQHRTSESTWFLTGKKTEMKSFDRIVVTKRRGLMPVGIRHFFRFHVCMPGGNAPQRDAIAIIFLSPERPKHWAKRTPTHRNTGSRPITNVFMLNQSGTHKFPLRLYTTERKTATFSRSIPDPRLQTSRMTGNGKDPGFP